MARLEALDLGDRRFERIFAVRVGLFHREPEGAHALAARCAPATSRRSACARTASAAATGAP